MEETSQGSPNTPAPQTPAPEAPKPAAPAANSQDVEQNKALAAVGYILFFVPLLAAKDSAFAKYHAKQGLALLITSVVLSIISSILGSMWVIWFIASALSPLIGLLVLVLMIIGIMNAINGKMTPLPVIGKIGESFKF